MIDTKPIKDRAFYCRDNDVPLMTIPYQDAFAMADELDRCYRRIARAEEVANILDCWAEGFSEADSPSSVADTRELAAKLRQEAE